MNECRLCAADLDAIDRLTQRVLVQGGTDTLNRGVILRALLRKGLDLATTREITGQCLSRTEEVTRVNFVLPAEDRARLDLLLTQLETQRPNSYANMTNLQRPLLLMALAEVKTRASFPAFANEVLLSLRLPRTRRRSVR